MKKTFFTMMLTILIVSTGWSQITSSNTDVTKKGSKVFIEFSDEASREVEPYFTESLTQWGYWEIVKTKEEAKFVIVFTAVPLSSGLNKTFMAITRYGYVVIKTPDDKEIKRSKTFKGSPTAFNGYKAIKDVVKNIMKKYLTKEFK